VSLKKRTCARCGTLAWPAGSFPEGHLCHPCLNAALRLALEDPGVGKAWAKRETSFAPARDRELDRLA